MPNPPQVANVINEPAAPLLPQQDTSAPVYVPHTPTTSIPVQPQDAVASTNTSTFQTNSPVVMTDPNVVQAQLSTIAKLLEVQNQNRLPLPEPGIYSI